MSKKSEKEAERQEAAKKLRGMLKPGQTVYTILRHVSSSGMSRIIDVAITEPNYRETYPLKPEAEASFPGERDYSARPKRKLLGHKIRSIGYLVARATGDQFDNSSSTHYGVKVSGFGMDMGFHIVYNLGRVLYPNGVNCAGPDLCQSNDHVNPGPDRDNYDRRRKHSDSGYAFKQEWL